MRIKSGKHTTKRFCIVCGVSIDNLAISRVTCGSSIKHCGRIYSRIKCKIFHKYIMKIQSLQRENEKLKRMLK